MEPAGRNDQPEQLVHGVTAGEIREVDGRPTLVIRFGYSSEQAAEHLVRLGGWVRHFRGMPHSSDVRKVGCLPCVKLAIFFIHALL